MHFAKLPHETSTTAYQDPDINARTKKSFYVQPNWVRVKDAHIFLPSIRIDNCICLAQRSAVKQNKTNNEVCKCIKIQFPQCASNAEEMRGLVLSVHEWAVSRHSSISRNQRELGIYLLHLAEHDWCLTCLVHGQLFWRWHYYSRYIYLLNFEETRNR